ncbi:hypothetical protein [Planctopirus ephydatiae]|uniref:hypothetical protein n=1 Tax=Planctopirus ephydatiae TaxID=2528019 RepID=UPI001643C708|nr:hypothetical protein [Planctopirus ephydatiae]
MSQSDHRIDATEGVRQGRTISTDPAVFRRVCHFPPSPPPPGGKEEAGSPNQ